MNSSQSLSVMRTKETEADYRYFREPDLLPVHLDEAWRKSILADLPELPLARRERFIAQYELPEYDADILTGERSLSDYFEAAVEAYGGDPKRVSNWLINDVLRMLNERSLAAGDLRLTPEYLAAIVKLVDQGVVNTNTGKSLLDRVQESGRSPAEIIEAEGLAQVGDEDALRAIVAEVLAENPEQVATYQGGKEGLLGWFLGQVMKKSRVRPIRSSPGSCCKRCSLKPDRVDERLHTAACSGKRCRCHPRPGTRRAPEPNRSGLAALHCGGLSGGAGCRLRAAQAAPGRLLGAGLPGRAPGLAGKGVARALIEHLLEAHPGELLLNVPQQPGSVVRQIWLPAHRGG